jgi:hypothetical protein
MTVIILALSIPSGSDGRAVANENSATCGTEGSPGPNLEWLENLSKQLSRGVASEPEPKKEIGEIPPDPAPRVVKKKVVEEPVFGTDQEPEDRPTGKYDLSDDPPAKLLTKLVNAAHWSAAVCRKGICDSRKSKYACYRGVKDALVKAGMVDAWWAEEAASDAHFRGSLARRGFRNVMNEGAGFNSKNAPLGAILVFSGGKKRCAGRTKTCGHIEIKVSQTDYCSDHCNKIPVDGYLNRKLVGVYVKE